MSSSKQDRRPALVAIVVAMVAFATTAPAPDARADEPRKTLYENGIGQLVLASACGYTLDEPLLPKTFNARITAVMTGRLPDGILSRIENLDKQLVKQDQSEENRRTLEDRRNEVLANGERLRPVILRMQAAIPEKHVRLSTAMRPLREKFESYSLNSQSLQHKPADYASVDVLCVAQSNLDCAVGDIVQVRGARDQTLIPNRTYIYESILGDPSAAAPPVTVLVEGCTARVVSEAEASRFPTTLAPMLTIDPNAARHPDEVGISAPEGWIVNREPGTVSYLQCVLLTIDAEGEPAAMFGGIVGQKEIAHHPEYFGDPMKIEGLDCRRIIPTIYRNISPEERRVRWPGPARISIPERPEFVNGQLRVLSIVRGTG